MRRVLKLLVLNGTISQELLDEIVAAVGERRAERELLRRGIITEEQLARALGVTLGIPYVDLSAADVDPAAVALLSAELSRRHTVLPISRNGGELTVAMADPEDIIALDDIGGATGLTVRPLIATRENMQQALDRYVRLDSQIADLSTELGATSASTGGADATENLDGDDDDAPIVRFVNLIVTQAIQDRASDIHIDPTENRVRVRYRIDGVLKDTQEGPVSIRDGVISRLKICLLYTSPSPRD